MTRASLIARFADVLGSVERAAEQPGRSYGGHIRKTKGRLLEGMTEDIIRIAWEECGGIPHRLSIGDVKTFRVYVQDDYVRRLPTEIGNHIERNLNQHYYRAQVDKHVFVDGEFVLGVECKAYAENAMLKRILVDFRMLKSLYPGISCCLLQMESMLRGSYSSPLLSPQMGSPATHTLMSHFPEVDLHIITLLEGEREIDRPIHKPRFFKELKPECLDRAIETLAGLLEGFV